MGILQAQRNGQRTHYRYQPATADYLPDDGAIAISRANLLADISNQDSLTFLGRLTGEGGRYGNDRNANTKANNQETPPALEVTTEGATPSLKLSWESTATDWYLESSTDLKGPWEPVYASAEVQFGQFRMTQPQSSQSRLFYRLKRIW